MTNFGKRTPFGDNHLAPFEKVFGKKADGTSKRTEGEYSFGAEEIEVDKETIVENQGIDEQLANSRWRCFKRDWIEETKGDSLDISWLKDKDAVDAANLPDPEVLAAEAFGIKTVNIDRAEIKITSLTRTIVDCFKANSLNQEK